MKSTSSACNTSASAKCPMRTLAITGMFTVAMISRIILVEAMRATPPSLRMSAGTRSSAITAHAPACSAMRACSTFVTSMMTPPFNISARPTFTRHRLATSFTCLATSVTSIFAAGFPFDFPLLFPFPFAMCVSLARFYFLNVQIYLTLRMFRQLCGINHHEPPAPARQHFSLGVLDFPLMIHLPPLAVLFKCFHYNFLVHADRPQEFDIEFGRNGPDVVQTAQLSHGLVQQHGDNSAM